MAGPQPKNKKYTTWSKKRRFDEGVRLVVHHGWSITEAALEVGVSRPRLSIKCKEERDKLAERAEQARKEVMAASPLGLNERRRVGTFQEFDDRYFSANWICPDCDVHHKRPEFHEQIINTIEAGHPRVLVNLPPFHAKSTLVTVKHTIYRLVSNPNHRRIIISKSSQLAKDFLESINQLLTNPELYGDGPNLIADWGPFKPESGETNWNQSQIYIAGRTTAEKDPSVRAIGVGNQIYGRRADDIVCDDIADVENQRNPERVMQMLSWLDKEVSSRIGKRGQLIYVGTRVQPGDVYSHLKERQGYQVLRYPCIIDEEGEQVLWPEHFPYSHAIVQRADMPNVADWQLIYQNVDTPGLGASFTQEMLDECKDTSRVQGHYENHWRLVAGLDLAGGTKDSGYTAMVLIGIDLQTNQRYLVDMVNVKSMRSPEMKAKILEWSDHYPIYEWRVENNGLQSQLVQYDAEVIRKLAAKGTRVTGHNTFTNKWDPQFGVESMAPLFLAHMISIPWGNAPTRQTFQRLLEQLIAFPMGVVNDLVMACWFAELGCRNLTQRAHLPAFNERMRVPDRIRRRRKIIDFHAQEVRGVPLHEQRRPGGTSIGQMQYRRQTVGRPVPHSEVQDPGPMPLPSYVNVEGSPYDEAA